MCIGRFNVGLSFLYDEQFFLSFSPTQQLSVIFQLRHRYLNVGMVKIVSKQVQLLVFFKFCQEFVSIFCEVVAHNDVTVHITKNMAKGLSSLVGLFDEVLPDISPHLVFQPAIVWFSN